MILHGGSKWLPLGCSECKCLLFPFALTVYDTVTMYLWQEKRAFPTYRPCAGEHISEKGRWEEGHKLRVVRIVFIEVTLNGSLLIVLEILWVWNTDVLLSLFFDEFKLFKIAAPKVSETFRRSTAEIRCFCDWAGNSIITYFSKELIQIYLCIFSTINICRNFKDNR